MRRSELIYWLAILAVSWLSGCQTRVPVESEICGKAMSARNNYLQCLAQKESGACEHLLRLYQADAQIYAVSGCVRPTSGIRYPMQSPAW